MLLTNQKPMAKVRTAILKLESLYFVHIMYLCVQNDYQKTWIYFVQRY